VEVIGYGTVENRSLAHDVESQSGPALQPGQEIGIDKSEDQNEQEIDPYHRVKTGLLEVDVMDQLGQHGDDLQRALRS